MSKKQNIDGKKMNSYAARRNFKHLPCSTDTVCDDGGQQETFVKGTIPPPLKYPTPETACLPGVTHTTHACLQRTLAGFSEKNPIRVGCPPWQNSSVSECVHHSNGGWSQQTVADGGHNFFPFTTRSSQLTTRSTVAHCKNPLDIHVYREIFDDENLYIELNQHSSITKFKVPLGVALAISHRLMYTLEETQRCAAMTDEDITAECLTAVDERMSFHSSIRELVGALRFGSCDNPIEQQVRHGVENMKAGRENCRRILQMAEEVTRGIA